MEDLQIVELYLARDEQAITETDIKYGSYCFSIAHRILDSRPDAEETVNDTYMGAWRSIPPHRPAKLNTYLGKITRRLALEELGECLPSRDTPEQTLEQKALTHAINAFLKSLPQTEQRIFICRYWHVYPVKTIARDFGFSESKVKSMLSRTRSKLKTYL